MTVQRFFCCCILLAGGASMHAQQAASPRAAARPAFALPVAPASEAVPAPGHSLLEQPATPARVTVDAGRLSVTAANASLSQTLRDISAATGTQIDGISKDQRIFGVYGPGSPQEVLTALLDDSGYNVMMVGRLPGGGPRQLVLSARAATSIVAASGPARPQAAEEDDDEPPTPPAAPTPAETAPAPAAAAAPGAPAQPGQVKTPQQMLEELQQLHRGQEPPALPRDQQQPQ